MVKRLILGVICIMTLVTAGCGTKFNKTSYEKGTVRGMYFEWVNAVESAHGNPEGVVKLYAEDAILLPTISPHMYKSRKTITKYFDTFLLLRDLQVDTQEIVTRQYGDIAMNTGFYTISYMNQGERVYVKARYDFWYKKINGKWEIIFHQSSMLPNED